MVHANMLLFLKSLNFIWMKTWERNQRVLAIYVASEQKSHGVEIPNKLRVTGDKAAESSTLFTCLTVAMTEWPHLDFWIKNVELSDLKCLGCMLPLPVFSWIKKQEKTMQWISKWHLISTQEINFTSGTGWGNPGEGHKGLAQREKGPWKALATQLNIPCLASGISLVCMCVVIILKETWLGSITTTPSQYRKKTPRPQASRARSTSHFQSDCVFFSKPKACLFAGLWPL